MIQSFKRYVRLFIITLFFKKEKLILLNHLFHECCPYPFRKKTFSAKDRKRALSLSIDWLLSAQENMKDGGFGTYYIVGGWSSSYPETSGYIIPTLYQYLQIDPAKKEKIETSIIKCADWLLKIQKPSGGWQSAYMEHNRPEVVFNTAQVLRGLIIALKMTGDKKYLTSMIKASDWLIETQEENGSWIKTAYMNEPRVYDSYVAHPLLMIWELTGEEKYKKAAIKNLDWILTQQESNGWFNNADNTQKHNHRPILHTIAYTIDGLINSGLILNDHRYIHAGKKAADKLMDLFSLHGGLNGRYDKYWTPAEYMICTGGAQISIVWSLLYETTGNEDYLKSAIRMNDQLTAIQQSCLTLQGEGNGALPGSFPLWGKYEPFGFPNWATKYLADALMSEWVINKKKIVHSN